MIDLKNKVADLTMYRKNFSRDEENKLYECFKQIQNYIKKTYMNPNYTLSKIELRFHETSFTHSYLVLDNEKNEVYLSHRDYSGEENNFFCTKECGIPIWKYTMCLVVIEKWEEIKEILHNELEKITTVDELCENFEI